MKHSIIKKISLLFMCITLVLGLVACGSNDSKDKDDKKDKKKVTAENLIADTFNSKDNKEDSNMQMDIDFGFGMKVDLKQAMLSQGLSESDIEEALKSGELSEDMLSMDISMEMNMVIEADDDKAYLEGEMNMEMMGEKEKETIKSYTFEEEDDEVITVTYDTELEEWCKYTEKSETDSITNMMESLEDFEEYIKSSEIIDEEDDVYTLKVVIDSEKLKENSKEVESIFSDTLGSFVEDSEDIYSSIDDMEMTLKIDSEDNKLVGISIDLKEVITKAIEEAAKESDSESEDYSKYISIDEFYIELETSKHGKIEVKIPDEVKEAEERDINTGEFEDWYDEEEEDNTEKDSEEEIIDVVPLPIDDSVILYDYDNNKVVDVNIPNGFMYDKEYSDNSAVVLQYGEYESTLWIVNYKESWVESLEKGEEWEVDTEWYISDKVEKYKTIETSQGDVNIYKRTCEMTKGYPSVVYSAVLEKSKDSFASFQIYETELEETGFNSIEDLITALYN